MDDKIRSFTDLQAWQEGHKLVMKIYQVTQKFPKEEQFGLTSQLRRSAVSITSNIAEGFGRNSYNERAHFFVIARGSLMEIQNQLLIAKDIRYLKNEIFQDVSKDAINTIKLLNGLINKTKEFIKQKKSKL
jgi:four helix bundle protein